MRISDWSSDVCSSDLSARPVIHQNGMAESAIDAFSQLGMVRLLKSPVAATSSIAARMATRILAMTPGMTNRSRRGCLLNQIGRASCRERVRYVEISVVAVSLKKKKKLKTKNRAKEQ